MTIDPERPLQPAPAPEPEPASAPGAATPAAAAPAPASAEQPLPVLVQARLAEAKLDEPVKLLLKEALGSGDGEGPEAASPAGRIHLESVNVSGFRGIGPKAWLNLNPRPGVTLVVGRNGCGKSSIAEAIETAFTGTNPRQQSGDATRAGIWRNLHDGAKPAIEVKLSIEGDPGPSRLTRSWPGEEFAASEGEFTRPGHGRVPADKADWKPALSDYRPFLSYADLDRMISGKPSQMYDAIATILGLGPLNEADSRLQAEKKQLDDAEKAVKEELPELVAALEPLGDDERAVRALVAIDVPLGKTDFAELDALVAGLPPSDETLLARLHREAEAEGPDPAEVRAAANRLREALADAEEARASGAEDNLQRADLLARALDHNTRHPYEESCPVCGTERKLDQAWVDSATDQVARLREEARAAEAARTELRSAVRAVQDLVREPKYIPESLAGPWDAWKSCRTIEDPAELAERAEHAAATLADACATVRRTAAQELAERDERWQRLVTRLAAWKGRAWQVKEDKARQGQLNKARTWIRSLSAELRQQRLDAFVDHSQRIWDHLRQESNVELESVSLHGSERATVRKLVMEVTVDGKKAPALSVMSQGEQHSLALSLFLPRAAAADSPFGFMVIDDPVQSMDPAKVHGLAQVLHELGQQRQVVVFTHDPRLRRAFTSQELPVTVLEVERGKDSKVKVRAATDPVRQAIDDARAIAGTKELPEAARTHVLPGLCRTALENAFVEAAWIRHHRAGVAEHALEDALDKADTLMQVAALGLFGDASRTGEVYRRLRELCGQPDPVDIVKQCQSGAHPEGARIPDPHRFVNRVEEIAKKVRKPEVTR